MIMAVLLHRWGAFAVRRCRAVLTVWLLAVVAIVALGVTFAGGFETKSDIPGSAAQSALEKMDHHFGASDRQSAQIAFEAPPGTSFKDPAKAAALKRSLTAAETVPGVSSVSDPMAGRTVTPDARTAVAQVEFTVAADEDVREADLAALKDTATGSRAAGIDVAFGGDAYKEPAALVGPMEGVGVLVALAVLAITFGSLLSAGMPLVTALTAVVASMAGLMGLSSVVGVSDKAPTPAIMLGPAVGIDYALFIVSRHRSELAQGHSAREAAARATATAGGAVAFAGLTVIIALAGLTVVGVPVLTSMGLSAAAAVAVAVAMSLGLLPALLAVVGERLRPRPGSRTARSMSRADDSRARPPMGARSRADIEEEGPVAVAGSSHVSVRRVAPWGSRRRRNIARYSLGRRPVCLAKMPLNAPGSPYPTAAAMLATVLSVVSSQCLARRTRAVCRYVSGVSPASSRKRRSMVRVLTWNSWARAGRS
ncbi:hypothetical protein A6A29_30255 [Streptomyces sp. TSRI0281]|nr:hypothetical protein A6A29_30255 [Streptomyces sp. TSRI0281]